MKKIDAKPHTPSPRARELLLYVEDNDDNWQIAELRLRQSYEVLRARDSREACAILESRGRELEVILMDIELRGSDLNGVELVELIRGKRARGSLPDYARSLVSLSTPIFFVTAHGAKYTEDFLLAHGADRVISKPVDFGALALALTHLHLARIATKRPRP
jgi:CheY-like chemotaxis protein